MSNEWTTIGNKRVLLVNKRREITSSSCSLCAVDYECKQTAKRDPSFPGFACGQYAFYVTEQQLAEFAEKKLNGQLRS